MTEEDRLQREQLLQRVQQELGELMGKLNARKLKTEAQISARVDSVQEGRAR